MSSEKKQKKKKKKKKKKNTFSTYSVRRGNEGAHVPPDELLSRVTKQSATTARSMRQMPKERRKNVSYFASTFSMTPSRLTVTTPAFSKAEIMIGNRESETL
jgi:hypothetical protein